jgi:hypothetical protein
MNLCARPFWHDGIFYYVYYITIHAKSQSPKFHNL